MHIKKIILNKSSLNARVLLVEYKEIIQFLILFHYEFGYTVRCSCSSVLYCHLLRGCGNYLYICAIESRKPDSMFKNNLVFVCGAYLEEQENNYNTL